MRADKLLGEAVLLGPGEAITRSLAELGTPDGVTVVDTASISGAARYRNEYIKARNLSVLENEILATAMKNPVVLGALMLRMGEADGFIGGVRTNTSEILSNGLHIIKAHRSAGVVTSLCVISAPEKSPGSDGILVIADPVVNPDPSVGVLVKIAEAAALFARNFLKITPRVAFLSYSTKGSGMGKSVDKMRIAAERARARMPETVVDGELQLDAAISPEVAARKAPGSPLAGNANVLIFPNLDSANLACKILSFFGSATIIGPIIYGLSKPYNDISRAAGIEDIINLSVITQLQE
jgi:phosphate acetyltransferase